MAEETTSSPIPPATPQSLGLDPTKLDRACEIVESHIAGEYHPGAQLAVARHGKLALYRPFRLEQLPPRQCLAQQAHGYAEYARSCVDPGMMKAVETAP